MDEEQAAEIIDYLLQAAGELDEARAAADLLADQDKDAAAISELAVKLNSELLETIVKRFPDLLPFKEFPAISSSLRWDQVRLPSSASEAQVDQIIFSVMTSRLQKTAMVIAKAMKRCEELNLEINEEIFGARIGALAESDRIDGAGDLRKWRHSEIRLKTEPAPQP
ncbi:DUF3658 domain-containing protein [Bradyrhizobium lablabi]|nr:DUF3658 domain-containing protein [Bradyrhizobium lablabi]